MIEIPLSQISSAADLAAALEAHRAALVRHLMGKPGVARPVAPPLIEALIVRIPESGPVAQRGPDQFVVVPYQVVDDRPLTEEAQQAIQVLRETIQG